LKIILGIGNPGRQYEGTRHNVGFQVVWWLSHQTGTVLGRGPGKNKVGKVMLESQPVLLAQPQTYVNLSGPAAQALLTYYRLRAEDMLVVVDDVNLPVGALRVRASGSAGGHNGLKSLIAQVGSGFPRLRIGVGAKRHPDQDLADHVLSRFNRDEQPAVDAAITEAAEACREWVREGIEACMNRFNATG
jgi:PTH1 family peptidyl-tRNA hydrolase